MKKSFLRTAVTITLYLTTAFGPLGLRKASAIPSFSLMTGTKCSACHFNPQGSGIRTELGWSMMNQTGLWQWKRAKPTTDTSSIDNLLGAGDQEQATTNIGTNTWFDGKVVPGFDARGEIANSSTTGKRVFIPMQFTTSIAYIPAEQLSLYTNINLASIEERIRGGNLYPGQTDFDAAIQYAPSPTLPSIRVGMIQPSVGIRQDDHTEYVRRVAAPTNSYPNRINLLPAYYNDFGAEVTYEGIHLLTVNAGVFNAKNLSEIEPSILGTDNPMTSNFSLKHPTISGRVMLWPQSLEWGINTEVGASAMVNGDFRMFNGFAGFGLADKATFYVEGMYSDNADQRRLHNWTVLGTYKLFDWLTAHMRYDWAETEYDALSPTELGYAQMFLFGFEFYPLPYIELRPEYRQEQQTAVYGPWKFTGEYTIQLHLFY